MMRSTLCLLLFTVSPLSAQQYEDCQLRLEPVWSRVADALGEYGSVESVEFSPDGKHIVSGTKYDNNVVLWRTSDGTELWRAYTAQEIERVAFSGNNAYVAAASEDYLVTVFGAETGEKLNELRRIDGLIWSNNGLAPVSGDEEVGNADGNYLISPHQNGLIKLWA